jgi:hypothetical protein
VDERKTYTGWKAALLAIALTFVVFALLNILGKVTRPTPPHPAPSPTVIHVSPS